MEKILSIIIPTYNLQDYIGPCVNSLIVSSAYMQYLEILIINDGSKDESSKIAHGLECKYPFSIKVIDKENGNYGSCINRGLKEAKGKYIRILDADDTYDTKNLESFLSFLLKTNADMIISNYCIVQNSNKRLVSYELPSKKVMFEEMLLNKYALSNLAMHSVTYKTSILHEINYRQTEGISYTDQEWICFPLINVNSYAYFNEVIYYYNLSREGQTCDPQVLHKMMGHNIEGIKSSILFFKELTIVQSFKMSRALQKLMQRIRDIYHTYLIEYHSLNITELKQLDLWLEENDIDIYVLLNDLKIKWINYPYVKKWRDKKYKKPFLLDGIHVLYKIINGKNVF